MTNIACFTGRVLFWFSLSLSACIRNESLGAAGHADGGFDVQGVADTMNVPVDAARDSLPLDGPIDVPDDESSDGPSGIVCVENGTGYHVGDVVPHESQPGCTLSCICLADGAIGHCTGACSPDAATDGGRLLVAAITVSRSSNSPEISVSVWDDGSAVRTVDPAGSIVRTALSYPAASPEVTLFLAHLAAVGDLSAVGDPSSFFAERCPKQNEIGTTTKIVTTAGTTSGDLQCLNNPTEVQTALAHDADVLTGMTNPMFGVSAGTCINTLGQISSGACCAGAGDLSSTCLVGACGCSPANSHAVTTCVCPTGGCFDPIYGCVGRPGVCTIGADQTCNDNPSISSLHGHCTPGGSCSCGLSYPLVAATGKCS